MLLLIAGVSSDGIMVVPDCVKICPGVQKLKGVDRQYGALKAYIFPFIEAK
jgi:hypothetical protein